MQSHENMHGIIARNRISRGYWQGIRAEEKNHHLLSLATNNVYSTVDLLPNNWS
jgi:hypothetical protein